MALVNVTGVTVMDNPTKYTNPFTFDVQFECIQELPDDIEWKVTYVGSANDPTQDQVLEEVLVGPVVVGLNRFTLQAPPPNYNAIAVPDLIGVTVLLITCSYMDEEFVRIGYYVNNEYTAPDYDPEAGLPPSVDVNYLYRNILADRPIVTRINIDWSGTGSIEMPPADSYDVDENEEMAINVGTGDNYHGRTLECEDSMDVDEIQQEARRIF
mmetsp:Transcript_6130/g.9245  ORF Transcript_6130/g.9245 Transcript_6130/m.9245 type:complete len:212 (+) Transcript_6130:59-694(+)|eukprot:CAMPEP_0185023506 /NCGR_PEP_ID=MMETSP1103-20130426/6174_1 /TAXON_ID=36769 /ORGANISM="Paraphysomonas bandaiensis, Strain Caron Lab Isolate" /LENGTH=211 /DNA_ID=CAMNT_0027556125 /DNA_START=38 /DNA_END=673 /DNA_ORIENTATION=+